MIYFVVISVFIAISYSIARYLSDIELKKINAMKHDEIILLNNELIISMIKKLNFITVFSATLSFFLFIFEQYIIYPSTVDLIPLQFLTIVFSAFFALTVGIYIFRVMPDSFFKFDLAKKYSLFTFFATFTIFMILIKYLNVWNDGSSLEVVQDTIQGKRDSNRAPLRKHFDLVNDRNNIDTYEIRVDSEVYDKKQIGDTATIYVKQGNFNIRWIEKVE
ncbi:MAG: hypothetical protein PHX59_00725 [Sulfuricurvum sp.]|nr:hypothetical protein [Sulfuricurvum sp.]